MQQEISSLWFLRLRWFSFFGQAFVLSLAVALFHLTLPWMLIAAMLSIIPISNLIAKIHLASRFPEKVLVSSLLVLDTIILTATLSQAGGPTNPFTIVYLLHVVLAAVMLTPRWTWGIAVISSLGYGCLFLYARTVPEWEQHGSHHGFSLHLHGMLFAYIVVSLLTAYFLHHIIGELRWKERKLERLENIAMNQQKLTSLTTITAGAAHELGTPLATIAVITHELERTLREHFPNQDLLDDLASLKEETLRCKKVLEDLSERTGDLIGEVLQPIKMRDLLEEAILPLQSQGNHLTLSGSLDLQLLKVPKRALVLGIRALVKNACEASSFEQRQRVQITARDQNHQVSLEITDHGSGMDNEILERIGEPFFSTKKFGKGMGLGVYLARLTLEQVGGSLSFRSALGKGTSAQVIFPIDCTQEAL